MNKKFDTITFVLLIILVLLIFLFIIKNNYKIEGMGTVTSGKVYLKGDYVNDTFDLSLKEIKELPIVEEDVVQKYESKDNDGNIIVEWEKKKVRPLLIINDLEERFNECGVSINLYEKNIAGVTSKKKFIQLLPIFSKNIKNKISYQQLKCFVKKFDPENFISIVSTEKELPRYLQSKNMIIVNQYLYQFTPYGTLKYIIPVSGNVDLKESIINASLEATLINDINKYNDSNYVLIPFKGQIYKIINNEFMDIKTGKKIDIENIIGKKISEPEEEQEEEQTKLKNIINNEANNENKNDNPYFDEFLEYRQKYFKLKQKLSDNQVEEEIDKIYNIKSEEEQNIQEEMDLPENYLNKIIYLINHSGIKYIVKPNLIKPNLGVGEKINNMIKKHNVILRGVIPHFFNDNDGKFQIEYLFLCNNDFFFRMSGDNISDLFDFRKKIGFSLSKDFEHKLSCQEYKSILDQLVSANKISNAKKISILNKLKCT